MPFRSFLLLAALPAFALLPAASAQTASTWNGGSGLWLDAPNWSPAGVPNSDSADVRVDNASGTASVVTFGYVGSVNSGFNARVGRLRIDAGDRVEYSNRPNTLSLVDTAFTGAGSIHLDGTLALPFTDNYLSGPKTFTGAGRLVLGSAGQRPEIAGRTVNGVTIEGSAAFGRANASNFTVLNSGLIDANVPGQDLDFHGLSGANRSVNTATMRATNGGQLFLGQGEWLNTGGTIRADGAGSLAAFYRGGLVEGGTLAATNGGLLQIGRFLGNVGDGFAFRNLTLQGPTSIPALQSLTMDGTVTNQGIITVAQGGRIDAPYNYDYDPALTVTLAGTGEVVLDSLDLFRPVFGYRRTRWLIQGQTIRGRGQVGDDDTNPPEILNRGTFQADRSGDLLRLRLFALDNQSGGVLRAQGGGILRIATANILRNTGGTIEALSGGRVEADFGRIEGGLVRNNGGFIRLAGMTLVNPGTGMRFEGDLTLSGTSGNTTQSARLVGDITNTGILRIQGGAQTARMLLTEDANRSVTLRGGGEVILGDPAQPTGNSQLWDDFDNGFSTRTLVNVDNTIRGFGLIGNTDYDRWLALQNAALVTGDVAGQTLTLSIMSATNATGVFRASGGGRLDIFARSGFNNANGTVEALNNSTVTWRATRITAGLISSAAPSGTLEFVGDGAADGGAIFANAGTLRVDSQGGTRAFDGLSNGGATLVNSGTLRKVGSGEFALSIALNSTGSILVDAGVLRNFGGGTLAANTVIAAAGTELTFQGAAPYAFSGVNILNGDGRTAIVGTTINLADAATELRAVNFRFVNATLSGPGLLSHSGLLEFHDSSSATVAGVRVLTLAGATASVKVQGQPFLFTNGATWENRGTILLGGYNPARVSGGAGTMLDNTPTGIVRGEMLNGGYGILDLPSRNAGRFEVTAWRMSIEKPSQWINGTAAIAPGTELNFLNPITFSGTGNTSTGAGQLFVGGAGSLAFNSGARFTAERIQFNEGTGASGPGELRIGSAGNFHPYGSTSVFSGTQVTFLNGSTSLVEFNGGTLRLQSGASFRNAGTLDFRRAVNVELNTGAVLENAGTMTVTSSGNNPSFGGDNSGLFRTTAGSTARYFPSNGNAYTIGWPFEFAGQVYADSGMSLTFDRGGLFNETAKVSPNHPASAVTFTGADKVYRARGRANEFPGTGVVNFVGTILQFDPSSIPGDPSALAAGARVAFQGNNIVRGQGTLSSTGFIFANGDQTVENATLETFGTADASVWNAAGRKIEFKAGAQFRNGGRFVIQSTVGSAGNPGFTGENGTRFHNLPTGTLVHDQNGTTEFNLDFQNDGELEVRAGRFNFLKGFTGTGGVAASGGGKVTLPLGTAAISQLPGRLRATGAGSEINVTLPGGDKFIRVDVNGGRLVAAGGGNLVAAGGLNLVAAGGGNLVAAGGMNLVAAGGGNITAQGINTLLQTNHLIGNDGSTLIGNDGSTLVAAGGMNLTNGSSASFSGAGTQAQIAGLIGIDGSTLIGNDGSTIQASSLIGIDGSTLIGNDGSTLIGIDGSTRPGPARRGISSTNGPGDPGSIVLASGSTLAGNGTFQGAGYIQSSAFLRPGKPVAQGGNGLGAMTWTGSLQVDPGATLFVELGGTTAGTQHDRINVSGAFAMNGTLAVSFLNGFGATVGPADVFDVVVSQTSVASALAGTRVPITGTYGSFAVQIVNGGKTLRLANFQIDPVTFSRWAQKFGLNGPNASPTADPNGSGLSNLMKYALGLDPSSPGGRGTSAGTTTDGQGNRYVTLSYTKPTGAETPTDVLYLPERASALNGATWSSSTSDVIPVGDPTPSPGTLQTVTVRSTHPIGAGNPRDFLRLRVSLP